MTDSNFTIGALSGVVLFMIVSVIYQAMTLDHLTLIPCPQEDSEVNCYWDAKVRGNSMGDPYIYYDGIIYYPER